MASAPPRIAGRTSSNAIVARAPARTRGIAPGGQAEERERDETADQVVGRGGARLGLHEAVVDDVQGQEADGEQEQAVHAATVAGPPLEFIRARP